MRALDEVADAHGDRPAVLVAHSLGCLAAVRWASLNAKRTAGLFLVAPPDRSGPNFPSAAHSFDHPGAFRLTVPTLVIGSEDDRYCDPATAAELAQGWGARIVNSGQNGHINSASGLGRWKQGHDLLTAFISGIALGATERSTRRPTRPVRR
jgi:predicted alpha/beta hydrolase family esterase